MLVFGPDFLRAPRSVAIRLGRNTNFVTKEILRVSSPLRKTTLPERFNYMREEQGEKMETWEEPHGKDPSERPLPCKPTVLRFCSTTVLLLFEMITSLVGIEYLQ